MQVQRNHGDRLSLLGGPVHSRTVQPRPGEDPHNQEQWGWGPWVQVLFLLQLVRSETLFPYL